MRDLERELRALEIDWPPTPDLAGTAWGARARSSRRWPVALAVAVLGATAAIEPARSAVLELFGLEGVRIERRDTPPPRLPGAGAGLGLGPAVTAGEARRRAPFARPPGALAAPDAIRLATTPAGTAVTYVYGRGPRLLVTVLRGRTEGAFIGKVAGGGTRIEKISAGGDSGYFLSGAPHGVGFATEAGPVVEQQRLAGNTLLLERGGLLVRVEGRVGRGRAIAIARSVPRGR